MKKILSIVLISCFLLHLAGFYVYFVIRQGQIHREARKNLKHIPDDQLEVFQFSKEVYQQALHNDDELKIGGKMYDIARIKVEENKIVVYALHDSAEDNLLSFIDCVLKNAAQDQQQVPSPLFQFSALAFILPSVFSYNHSLLLSHHSFTNYFASDLSHIPSFDTPPPRS